MSEQVQTQEQDPACGACGCPYPGGNCWTAFEKENERLRSALAEIASGLSVRNPFDIANEALKQ